MKQKTKSQRGIRVFSFLFVLHSFALTAQLTDHWQGPNGQINVIASKENLVLYCNHTKSFQSIKLMIDTTHYPLQFFDSSDIIDSLNYYTVRVRLLPGFTDSQFVRCFRYFRDSLGSNVAMVGNSIGVAPNTSDETNELIIQINSKNRRTSLDSWCSANGCQVASNFFDSITYVVVKTTSKKTTMQLSNMLSFMYFTSYAEPNLRCHNLQTTLPNDPLLTYQWGLNNTGSNCQPGSTCTSGADAHVTGAWDKVTGCNAIKIDIFDDGVEYSHEDLSLSGKGYNAFYAYNSNQYWSIPCGSTFYDRCFLTNGGNIWRYGTQYDAKHGTACAGIAGAIANNSKGVAGVAYGVSIEGMKMLFSSGTGDMNVIAAAFRYAVDSSFTDITSSSWIWPYQQYTIATAISYATAKGRNGLGLVVVQSSGNGDVDGNVCNSSGALFPASIPSTIAVSGSTSCDQLKLCSSDCSVSIPKIRTS